MCNAILKIFPLKVRTPSKEPIDANTKSKKVRKSSDNLMFKLDWTMLHYFADLLDDIIDTKPKEAVGIDAVIVVDNLPVIGNERLPKLKGVLKKIFSKFGEINSDFYPIENDKTKG